MKKPGKAYFMISAVAQKYSIHPQTLRLYEREGLLNARDRVAADVSRRVSGRLPATPAARSRRGPVLRS